MSNAQGNPFIYLKGITKSFGGVQALNKVDLKLFPGEIHALAGENGSGKSTLIKILSGVYQADDGIIEIDGKQFSKMTPMESVRMGIQIIYQDFSVFPNLTVRENIAISSEIMMGTKLVHQKRMSDIADEAIKRLNLNIDLDAYVEQLSVAEKQLVALARAMHNNARLIVMDEPTTALTYNEVRHLFNVIKGLQKKGIAILFVSHKINEVFRISENYTVLRNGEVVANGLVSDLSNDDFTYYMTGRRIKFAPLNRKIEEKEVLSVKHLGREGYFTDVSFKLKYGEILAIVGPLGSGRTEIAEALFGIHPAETGEIIIKGMKVKIKTVSDAMKFGIGYVPEDRLVQGLFMRRSIMDNAIVSNIEKHSNCFGVIRKLEAELEGARWMEEVNLNTKVYGNAVSSLSGGNQQKVILSRWIATNPSIFILNSPTVGVDIGAKYNILEILKKLTKMGISIIIISDDISEVLSGSDRILVVRNGEVLSEFQTKDVSEEKINQMLYGDIVE